MKRRFDRSWATALHLGVLLVAMPASVRSQSNIVFNGSFEQIGDGWLWSLLGVHLDQGAADGRIHISVEGHLQQDLPTVPGRDYVLSLAAYKFNGPSVSWGGIAVPGLTNFGSLGTVWDYRYCYVRAESNVTQLQFAGNNAGLDDVRVYWVQDPIRVLAQPQSRSAFEGGAVSFVVKADGAPPLRYQWFFNDAPIVGATNSSFTASQLRLSHTGNYAVSVSNSWNSITSEVAQLQVVIPPTSPEILSQPAGDLCPVGYGCTLQVVATGDAPLGYQWLRDGSPLLNATNGVLVFSAAQVGDAGTYSVIVSNHLATVLSLPAVLEVTNTTGGGRVTFDSRTNNAPIFDVDGATRLGTGFVAQVYAGATPGILRPLGGSVTFSEGVNGANAGYIRIVNRQIPDVAVGQIAYLQVRAWEKSAGDSYERARALGGKYGFSAIAPTLIGQFGSLVAMQSFSLRVGQPFFVAGILGIGEIQPDQPLQLTLTGEVGARYLVEKRQLPNNWIPFLILTNTSGISFFTDPGQTNSGSQLYRARILD